MAMNTGPAAQEQLEQIALRRALIEDQRRRAALLQYARDTPMQVGSKPAAVPAAGSGVGAKPRRPSLLYRPVDDIPPDAAGAPRPGEPPDWRSVENTGQDASWLGDYQDPLLVGAALSLSAPAYLAGPQAGVPASLMALRVLGGLSLLAAATSAPGARKWPGQDGRPSIPPALPGAGGDGSWPGLGRPQQPGPTPGAKPQPTGWAGGGDQPLGGAPIRLPGFSGGDPEIGKLLAPGGVGPFDHTLPDPWEWINDLPSYVENSKGGPQVQKEIGIIKDKILAKAKQYGIRIKHTNGADRTEKTFKKEPKVNAGSRRSDLSFNFNDDGEEEDSWDINHHDTWKDGRTPTRREDLAAQDIRTRLKRGNSFSLFPKSRWFSSQQEWERVIDSFIEEAFNQRFGPPPQ